MQALSALSIPSEGPQWLSSASAWGIREVRHHEAEEAERRRIARELHDGISQQVAVLIFGLAQLAKDADNTASVREELVDLRHVAEDLAREVRDLSHRLHPPVLEHLGLVTALRSYCDQFAEREKIRVRFFVDASYATLREDLSTAIYRIVQEALRNVAKHARAASAEVRLWRSGKYLNLSVSDDGAGFATGSERQAGGIGLAGMSERARLVGGGFKVQSIPGRGTTIRVIAPVSIHQKPSV